MKRIRFILTALLIVAPVLAVAQPSGDIKPATDEQKQLLEGSLQTGIQADTTFYARCRFQSDVYLLGSLMSGPGVEGNVALWVVEGSPDKPHSLKAFNATARLFSKAKEDPRHRQERRFCSSAATELTAYLEAF